MTGLLQRIQALFMQFAQAAATDQVGHAGDGIEWRTDFVTDVGQELAFRRAGLLGGQFGQHQLVGPFGHQLFQMFAVVFQFRFDAAGFGDVAGDGGERDRQPFLSAEGDFPCFDDARRRTVLIDVFGGDLHTRVLPGVLVGAGAVQVEFTEDRAQLSHFRVGFTQPGKVFQAQIFFGGGIDLQPAVAAVLEHDNVGQGVDEAGQELVAVAQCGGGVLGIGNALRDGLTHLHEIVAQGHDFAGAVLW